ncbi:MAG: gamma-glutamyltransferase family protein [Betaproteobacteria bacterium]|jgi:gamma-glutamyltranspeptidase/glutathione hydrolase
MNPHLVQHWNVSKPLATSRGGIVASQNRIASEAGARILAAGGNAVDAAVATGLALAAVEPWNSGLGGVGFMMVYLARENCVQVVDFGPISPYGLNPADYPLTGGYTSDLFTWPSVQDDRNVHGPMSIAIPGHVDGLATALETFGTLPFREVAQPAIALADEGIAVDWYLTLKVATMAKELSRYPVTRDIWLPGGFPPDTAAGAPLGRLKLKGLADTLRRLAEAGPRDFYEGEIAAGIARDIKAMGGNLSASDLANFHARIVAPIETEYHGASLALPPQLTAGPTMLRALEPLRTMKFSAGKPGSEAFVAYAAALREAYTERLASMGDNSDRKDPSTTTHLNVIDRDGNMVALTQTLLSVFGSKVVLPSSGVLMNNGMMWFDPRPESPNCLAPGKRALSNMCPVIATVAGKPWFAIGASGGRKILPAVYQISSFLIDHGMSLKDAFHQPRIDASGGDTVGVDPRHDQSTVQALGAQFPVNLTELVVYPTNFACPSAVLHDPNSGEHQGISDVMSPWSGAVAES